MNAVFSVGGDALHPDIPNNFLRLLAEGNSPSALKNYLLLNCLACFLKIHFDIIVDTGGICVSSKIHFVFLSRI